MAERGIILLIRVYQAIGSLILKHLFGVSRMCRFTPSCSEYTARMIQRHGIIKGLRFGANQLLHCHPLAHTYGTTI